MGKQEARRLRPVQASFKWRASPESHDAGSCLVAEHKPSSFTQHPAIPTTDTPTQKHADKPSVTARSIRSFLDRTKLHRARQRAPNYPAMLYSALVTATLAACALAAPRITSPAAGASLPVGGGSITVEWEDDGKAPKISQLTSFTLQLVVGGNTEANSVRGRA